MNTVHWASAIEFPLTEATPVGAELVLRSERLVLRPLRDDDRAEWLASERANAEFWRSTMPALDPGVALEDRWRQQLERSGAALRSGTGVRLTAFDADQFVGSINLNQIARGVFMNAALGWRVTRAAEGRGLAFEMVGRAIDYAFAGPPLGLGLHRVEANIMPDNERSLRLAARLGLRREGLALRMLKIAGEWRDHVVHAKLADEHEAGQSR